jgi:hypothetical protein
MGYKVLLSFSSTMALLNSRPINEDIKQQGKGHQQWLGRYAKSKEEAFMQWS